MLVLIGLPVSAHQQQLQIPDYAQHALSQVYPGIEAIWQIPIPAKGNVFLLQQLREGRQLGAQTKQQDVLPELLFEAAWQSHRGSLQAANRLTILLKSFSGAESLKLQARLAAGISPIVLFQEQDKNQLWPLATAMSQHCRQEIWATCFKSAETLANKARSLRHAEAEAEALVHQGWSLWKLKGASKQLWQIWGRSRQLALAQGDQRLLLQLMARVSLVIEQRLLLEQALMAADKMHDIWLGVELAGLKYQAFIKSELASRNAFLAQDFAARAYLLKSEFWQMEAQFAQILLTDPRYQQSGVFPVMSFAEQAAPLEQLIVYYQQHNIPVRLNELYRHRAELGAIHDKSQVLPSLRLALDAAKRSQQPELVADTSLVLGRHLSSQNPDEANQFYELAAAVRPDDAAVQWQLKNWRENYRERSWDVKLEQARQLIAAGKKQKALNHLWRLYREAQSHRFANVVKRIEPYLRFYDPVGFASELEKQFANPDKKPYLDSYRLSELLKQYPHSAFADFSLKMFQSEDGNFDAWLDVYRLTGKEDWQEKGLDLLESWESIELTPATSKIDSLIRVYLKADNTLSTQIRCKELIQTEDVKQRYFCLSILRQTQAHRSWLMPLLKDSEFMIRSGALETLMQEPPSGLAQEAFGLYLDGYTFSSTILEKLLQNHVAKSDLPLLEKLAAQDSLKPGLFLSVYDAIFKLDEDKGLKRAQGILEQELKDTETEDGTLAEQKSKLRYIAFNQLSKFPIEQTRITLRKALTVRTHYLYRLVAELLVKNHDPEVRTFLFTTYHHSEEIEEQRWALNLLWSLLEPIEAWELGLQNLKRPYFRAEAAGVLFDLSLSDFPDKGLDLLNTLSVQTELWQEIKTSFKPHRSELLRLHPRAGSFVMQLYRLGLLEPQDLWRGNFETPLQIQWKPDDFDALSEPAKEQFFSQEASRYDQAFKWNPEMLNWFAKELLKAEPSSRARQTWLTILSKQGTIAELSLLRSKLSSEDVEMILALLQICLRVPETVSWPEIKALTQHRDTNIRSMAAQILRRTQ